LENRHQWGEMAQTLRAHMNKKKKKEKIAISAVSEPQTPFNLTDDEKRIL
jgi:hypothetical protein